MRGLDLGLLIGLWRGPCQVYDSLAWTKGSALFSMAHNSMLLPWEQQIFYRPSLLME
ncbi:hypothetical protein X474_08800 [Dethiosulfatarculus sandiegensis]|uniref:Uncharacterized protein n=1 Tax=Dethiosulfatarculus sandiegensis TaxID=1429043 RepID=A0A0D2JF69_9BACT|nr:hypothetical protein X474_08800 [Dethiosulfatarculus sandiegensis]